MDPGGVLVVDDEPALRDTLKDILNLAGYEVDTAADGLEALDRLREVARPVVIMDIMMPRMNGVEAFKAIHQALPETFVVLMTGFTVADLIADAQDHGCRHILRKPLDIPKLLELIEKRPGSGPGGDQEPAPASWPARPRALPGLGAA